MNTLHTYKIVRINNLTLAIVPREYIASCLDDAIAMANEACKDTMLSVIYRNDGTVVAQEVYSK